VGTLTLVTAPTIEPVTLDEAQAHLRLDQNVDDVLVETLIQAAREIAEAHTRRAIMLQTWDWKLDGFPACEPWELPKAPLLSVTSISYVDANGTTQTWSSSNYTVLAPAGARCLPGTVSLGYGVTYPVPRSQPNAVTVRYTCGYSSSATAATARAAVPAAIKAAMLLTIGELYARRENAVVGTIINEVPLSAARLLAPYVVHGW